MFNQEMINEYLPYIIAILAAIITFSFAMDMKIFEKERKKGTIKVGNKVRDVFLKIDEITEYKPFLYLKNIIRKNLEFTVMNYFNYVLLVNIVLFLMLLVNLILALVFVNLSIVWYQTIISLAMAVILPYFLMTLIFDLYKESIGKTIPKMIDVFRSKLTINRKIVPSLKETGEKLDNQLGKILVEASNSSYFDVELMNLKSKFRNLWLNMFVTLIVNYKENGGELVSQLHKLTVAVKRSLSVQKKKDKRLVLYEIGAILGVVLAIPLSFMANRELLGGEFSGYENSLIVTKIIVWSIVSLFVIRILRKIGSNDAKIDATNKKNYFREVMEVISEFRPINGIINIFTVNEKSFLNNFCNKAIVYSESLINLKTLYLYKILSVFFIVILSFAIQYTNMNILKNSVIANNFKDKISFLNDAKTDSSVYIYKYNEINKKILTAQFESMNTESKYEYVKKISKSLDSKVSEAEASNQAMSFIKTYDSVNQIQLIDLQFLLIILLSFFLPEILIISRRFAFNSAYEAEVLKFENIIELLGGTMKLKTIDIIKELESTSSVYKKHLNKCINSFNTDKEKALIDLKEGVRNNNFKEIIDVLITYSMSDKRIALEILSRNMRSKEEHSLLVASEDVDRNDIIAFMTMIPILYYIIMLLVTPLRDNALSAMSVIF